MANKPNTPDDFSMEISATKETAFQRAIWGCVTSKLGCSVVRWLDIEIPVDCSGNSRGRSIDLIGIDDEENYVVCELKFGDNAGTDSPLDAVDQIMFYKNEIARHAGSEACDFGHHKRSEARGNINWSKVAAPNTRWTVAANNAYWGYWLGHRHVSLTNKSVEYYSLPVSVDTFALQHKQEETYIPRIESEQNVWSLIDELRWQH